MPENTGRSVDERLEALTMNLELMWHSFEAKEKTDDARARKQDQRLDKIMTSLEKLVKVSNQDATAIRKLAAIAEVHQTRISNLEHRL